MSKRNDTLLLEDMLEACTKIRLYVKGMNYDFFNEDDKTKDAVIRNFEIIGEAASRLNTKFRERHPQVDWRRIRGFRNRIVHEYFGIDYEIVWSIIVNDLEELQSRIKKIIYA